MGVSVVKGEQVGIELTYLPKIGGARSVIPGTPDSGIPESNYMTNYSEV